MSYTPSSDMQPPVSSQGMVRLPLSNPLWVYLLLTSIIIIFIIEQTFPFWFDLLFPGIPTYPYTEGSNSTAVLLLMGANFTDDILDGEVWRFFTSMFLHIGIGHIFFNGYALFALGLDSERLFGQSRFIIIYILSGLFGSLSSFAFHDCVLSAGASGAIFGLIGMQAAYFYKHQALFGDFGKSRLTNSLAIIVINLFFGFSYPGIDNMAHLGGLFAGFALAYTLAPNYQAKTDHFGDHELVEINSPNTQTMVIVAAIALLVGGTIIAMQLRTPCGTL